MSLESSKYDKYKIWEQCDAFRMILGLQLTLGESLKSRLKIYWLLKGLKKASCWKGIKGDRMSGSGEERWRLKMMMGLKEIEEEVVERCRVGFRKLRSARRVTVFWCFDVLVERNIHQRLALARRWNSLMTSFTIPNVILEFYSCVVSCAVAPPCSLCITPRQRMDDSASLSWTILPFDKGHW